MKPHESGAPATVLFLFSGSSISELRGQLTQVLSLLQNAAEDASVNVLQEIAVRHGRGATGDYRLAVLAGDCGEMAGLLARAGQALHEGGERPRMPSGAYFGCGESQGRLAFLFPGQGSQFPGMLLQAAEIFPSVQTWLTELDKAYVAAGRKAPSCVLRENEAPELLDMQFGAQLGLVAGLAMAEVLGGLSVRPDCLVGHSNGEHGALLAAGAIGSCDAAEACAEFARGSTLAERIVPPAEPQAMLAVAALRRPAVEAYLREQQGQLFVAIDNAPLQIVLGGTLPAIEAAEAALRPPVALCSRLPFPRAYHTPLFSDWSALLHAHLRELPVRAAKVPVYSGAIAGLFPADAEAIRELMSAQWSQTVRFRETIEAMYADGVRTFVEVGPDAKLTALVRDILRGREHAALSVSSAGQGDWSSVLQACGRLFASGRAVDMRPLDEVSPVRPRGPAVQDPMTAAPVSTVLAEALYREHQKTMTLIEQSQKRVRDRLQAFTESTIAERCRTEDTKAVPHRTLVFEAATAGPWITDHAMGRKDWGGAPLPILPFTYTLGLVCAAARRQLGAELDVVLEHVRAHRWLALDRGSLRVELEANEDHVLVRSGKAGEAALAFEAAFRAGDGKLRERFSTLANGPAATWTAERFYADFAFHGPVFRLLRNVRFEGEAVEAEIANADRVEMELDAAALDCAGQLAAMWLLEKGRSEFGAFPFAMERFEQAAGIRPSGRLLCRGRVVLLPFDITSISVDFVTTSGEVLYRVMGLQQKIVAFPKGMSAALFGKTEARVAECVQAANAMVGVLPRETVAFLETQQAIWARILAHSMFTAQELDRVYHAEASQRWSMVSEELLRRDVATRWRAANGGAKPKVRSAPSGGAWVAVAFRPDNPVRLEPLDTGSQLLWEERLGGEQIRLYPG